MIPKTRQGPLSGFDKGVAGVPASGLQDDDVEDKDHVKYAPIAEQIAELNRRVDDITECAGLALQRLYGSDNAAGLAKAHTIAPGVFGAIQSLHRSVGDAAHLVGTLAAAI